MLSLLVKDSGNCGGVHPFDETFPLVYDLRTGDAVRWERVLRKGRVKEVKTGSADGMPWIVTQSKRLKALYLANYGSSGICREEIALVQSGFHLYPEEKANALEILPAGLPQVAHDCATPLALNERDLRSLGVSQQWRDTILGRHQAAKD